MTCWRRFEEWEQAGVFQALHERLLAQRRSDGRLDLSRAVCDSASLRALFGGEKTGPSPVDRRKLGSKHHLITDAKGIPLACLLTGADAHDVTQLLPLVEAIPPIRGVVGRPRRRPSVRSRTAATTRKRIGKRSAPAGSGP